ncbi:MAG: arginine decarboxylase [Nocardioidaceae bacterium]|nr:arginine decarboxylase [Nocardioidaceae bacterium]
MTSDVRTPLVDAYVDALRRGDTPFTVPGHKRRTASLDTDLGLVVDTDVPLFAGLDTMKLSGDLLLEAEALAADLWGADWCRFGTGGASQANQALMLALGRPGEEIVMSRSIHRSVMSGLVLAGLDPVWLPVGIDDATMLPLGPTPAQLDATLTAHPEAAAVWVCEPSYLGTVADLARLADAAHRYDVPLVVDQAWAAHFGFHPGYPPHALAAGADAMVISAHKALPGYSQAAIALATTTRLSAHRLQAGFDATNTTSPAGAILASIDGSRGLLAGRGERLLGDLADLVAGARARLVAACPGLTTPGPRDFDPGRFDPAKLVLMLAGTGADGIDVGADLDRQGITLEMADPDTLVATVTVADTRETVRRLTDALVESINLRRSAARPPQAHASWTVTPQQACTPREAFFAPSTAAPADRAIGRISAELVAIYPPGVPILAPGERITPQLLDTLQRQAAAGNRIAYADDPTLATLRVVV